MPWYTTADARRDAEKQAAAKIDPLQNPGVQGLAQLGRNSIDRVTQLEAEIARLKRCLERANAQAEKFEREWYLRGDVLNNTEYWLGSLLAVIHRDGGHYQAEHGTKKACDQPAVAAAPNKGIGAVRMSSPYLETLGGLGEGNRICATCVCPKHVRAGFESVSARIASVLRRVRPGKTHPAGSPA